MKDSPKTVLITGSSTGFGASIARAFARAGYAVVLHGRNKKNLTVVKDEILEKTKFECPIVVADLQSTEGIDAIAKTLRDRNVDILINNAAINPELNAKSIVSNIKEIENIISTNTSSAIVLCYTAFEHFKTNGAGGTIVNINSVAALRGSSHEAIYAVSKFGLRGFSESVKEDWLKKGVKMIDVYPGALGTGMSAARSDVKNLIDPSELADLLVGLCETKSFFVKELNVRRTVV
jgi:short-subunit dehydrogenase